MTSSRRRVHPPIIIINIGNIEMALVGRVGIIKHIVIMYRGVILLVASIQ